MSDGDRDTMARVGAPDGSAHPRPNSCPGAAIMVDAEGYRELARIGQIWATKVEDVEPHGRFSARVYCREETEVRWVRGSAVVYGLCKSCSDAEANQRRDMRDKAAMQSGRRER